MLIILLLVVLNMNDKEMSELLVWLLRLCQAALEPLLLRGMKEDTTNDDIQQMLEMELGHKNEKKDDDDTPPENMRDDKIDLKKATPKPLPLKRLRRLEDDYENNTNEEPPFKKAKTVGSSRVTTSLAFVLSSPFELWGNQSPKNKTATIHGKSIGIDSSSSIYLCL